MRTAQETKPKAKIDGAFSGKTHGKLHGLLTSLHWYRIILLGDGGKRA